MPFIHFHVNNGGEVSACCISRIPFGNIQEATPQEIWNDEAIRTFRKKMLHDEADNRCKVCYEKETSGSISYREEILNKYLDTFRFDKVDTVSGVVSSSPIYLDIRFSNHCNFRCRTCWHGASSKWFREAQMLKRQASEHAVIRNVKDVGQFVKAMQEWLPHLREIYFAGGEPLVMEGHYALLQALIDIGKTDVVLKYNTNFSLLSYKQYDLAALWQYFPTIELMASLDGMDRVGAFIRKEMDWSVICENRQLLRKLPHVRFMVAPTISVLNIFHIPQFCKFLLSENWITPDDWYINILHRPFYYNIQALPPAIKEAVRHSYQSQYADFPLAIQKSFTEILNFMEAQDLSSHWKAFLKESQKLDALREESVKAVVPQLFL